MLGIRDVGLKAFALSLWTLVGMLAISGPAHTQTLPFVDKEIHMGVATCAGSTCHGAIQPLSGISILQNEFITWQRNDKHAKAYQVLLNDRSKRIARNLGLKSAETAAICLDCHADNVPIERRHRTFQVSDGVTCEACHGGAGRWIGTHISAAATHKVNIENGLYPSADPISRAKLCLSCHFGDETRFVTHRIMGAGSYGEMLDAAKALKKVLGKLMGKFAEHAVGKADMQALLSGVVANGLAGEYRDYPGAEQATMALSAIVEAMRQSGDIDSGQFEALNAALEKTYAAVAKDEEYESAAFIAALTQFKVSDVSAYGTHWGFS